MVNSIEQLKGQIGAGAGLALPNLYLVEMPSDFGVDIRSMNMLCQSTALPGRQILTHDRQTNPQIEKIAYGFGVAAITMSFKMLNDYGIKKYFDNWQNQMFDQENLQIKYASNYRRSIKIWQLKKGPSWSLFNAGSLLNAKMVTEDEKIYGVELLKAFPTTVTDIEFADGNNDQFIQFSATFDYSNWKPI